MSDYFSRQGVDDIIRSIISSWSLEEIQELQLVNRKWRQMIASPDFGYQILGKDAIFMGLWNRMEAWWLFHSFSCSGGAGSYCSKDEDSKTNEWSHQNIVYGNSDWKIEAISQDEGVFVNGVFAWLGRGIRDNHVFHCIILYDGKRELFDSMELPESLNRPGLVLRSLADDIVGVWKRETKDCIWVCNFESRVFDKIKIHGYSDSGAEFEPLSFSKGRTSSLLLLLVNRRRLELYDVENKRIQRQFPDLPTARFSTKMTYVKAIRFRDTFESPGEDLRQ
ncbi:hypothetical protein ACLB2K_046357 [Fragaria x ananassa]